MAFTAYTDEFFTITRKGHDRTTQSFGAPTLVWHVGIWAKPAENKPQTHNAAIDAVCEQLNRVIGRLRPFDRDAHSQDAFQVQADANSGLRHLRKESVNFTVWWGDGKTRPGDRPTPPTPEHLRVRVQFEVHPDFATITFFIDAGKCHGDPNPVTGGPGARRQKIFRYADLVRSVGERRFQNGVTGLSPLAEAGVSPAEQDDLLAAARYLYSDKASDDGKTGGVWEEFCTAYDLHLPVLAGEKFEVFVNLRGLVLAAEGTPGGDPRLFQRFQPERAAVGLADEPNALVHAYWPFIRRSRSEADYRDWIACGVLDFRGIFISSLGAQSQYAAGEEEDPAALPRSLPTRLVGNETHIDGKDLPAPFRYLLLTKGEPDRKQIGRMVDRVNTLSTLQLYAFKNWGTLRNANVLIRQYGRELDEILENWVHNSDEIFREQQKVIDGAIQTQHDWFRGWAEEQPANKDLIPAALRPSPNLLAAPVADDPENSSRLFFVHMRHLADLRTAILRRKEGHRPDWETKPRARRAKPIHALDLLEAKRAVYWQSLRVMKSRRDEDLSQVNQLAERDLIRVSRLLDDLGRRAEGGLQSRINRSRYYAETYREILKTMRCGNIETWWTYDQFASRCVDPVFRLIDGIGHRLERLRDRLQNTMESVQTSAIVNQTEATRDNTYQMENIVLHLEHLSVVSRDIQLAAQLRARRDKFWGSVFKFGGWVIALLGIPVAVKWEAIRQWLAALSGS
jgi:hypothetical protein